MLTMAIHGKPSAHRIPQHNVTATNRTTSAHRNPFSMHPHSQYMSTSAVSLRGTEMSARLEHAHQHQHVRLETLPPSPDQTPVVPRRTTLHARARRPWHKTPSPGPAFRQTPAVPPPGRPSYRSRTTPCSKRVGGGLKEKAPTETEEEEEEKPLSSRPFRWVREDGATSMREAWLERLDLFLCSSNPRPQQCHWGILVGIAPIPMDTIRYDHMGRDRPAGRDIDFGSKN